MYDELFEYLMANNMLDDNFGFKKTIRCVNCKKDLYIVEKGLLFCKKCGIYVNYDPDKKIANKKLEY